MSPGGFLVAKGATFLARWRLELLGVGGGMWASGRRFNRRFHCSGGAAPDKNDTLIPTHAKVKKATNSRSRPLRNDMSGRVDKATTP